jgi:hypothetical protein
MPWSVTLGRAVYKIGECKTACGPVDLRESGGDGGDLPTAAEWDGRRTGPRFLGLVVCVGLSTEAKEKG